MRVVNTTLADFFDKGITMGSGQCPVKKCNECLRDLMVNERARPEPDRQPSHPHHKAPKAYDKFDKRVEGYTKGLIRFPEAVAA